MENLLVRQENETFDQYENRLYTLKLRDNLFTWEDIVEALNSIKPQKDRRKRDTYSRKAHKMYNEGLIDFNNYLCEPDPEVEYKNYLTTIKKERYKLSEERIQNNAYIRMLAREETLKEIASDFANKMSKEKLLTIPAINVNSQTNKNQKEGILCLSDWHYGIEVNNYFNNYNPEICRQRVNKLLLKVINICNLNNIKKIYVVNLGDLICGRIHLTLRLESREDVISQTMEVSEILAEFLNELSQYCDLVYTDCLDNHSRLEPRKSEAMELETLARITPWYLKQRLSANKNIKFLDNKYADDIVSFSVLGHEVVGVHGHKDKPDKVIENMISMTRKRNDLVISSHYHHFSCDESHECLRISNGSLMGVDQYAQDLRLTNKPSQNFIISSEEDVAEVIYKINLG